MLRVALRFLAVLVVTAVGPEALSQSDFESPVVYPVAQESRTVAVGDLNGDGLDDVAITAWPSGLYILYQHSDGSLRPPLELYAPTLPLGLAIGDLNGDLRMDLAVGGTNGVIYLYYQANDGTFGLPALCSGYGWVNSLAIDDLNGDGLADIVDTSADIPAVLVSIQAPDGTFGLPYLYPVGGSNARCIRTLDYNSDGIRDVALLLDNEVCYLYGAPSGGLEAPGYLAAQWAYALAAGDVTGDGRDDLVYTVATNQPDAAVGVVPQVNGFPGAQELYPAYDFAQALVLADINEDGRHDVVAAHAGYEAVTVLCQNAGGALDDWTTYAAPYCNGYEPEGIATGDLNSDGHPDLALADWWNGLVVFLRKTNAPDPLPDTTPPTCTTSISGTLGSNGWYVSAVIFTITAQDEAGGSGLSDIAITLDGTTWSSYSEPVVICAQGTTSIGCYAEDVAGNRSDTQWVNVGLDTEPPVLAIETQVEAIWPPNGEVVNVPVNVAATDATSGIADLHLAVIDEYGLIQPETDVALGVPITVPLVASRDSADSDGRVYTLVLTGTDSAGNVAQVAATVVVPHSKSGKPKKKK